MPKMMQNRMCAPGKSRRGIGGVLRELFTYSNKLKAPSVAAFCFAVAGAVLTIIGPSLLSRITDLISDALDGEIDLAAIGRTGVILLVIYGFSAVFTYVEHYIMATVTLGLSKQMRRDLCAKINRVPMSYFNRIAHGDILSRVTNDVSTLQQALSNSLPSMISAVAQLTGCVIMMFVTEWRMALAAIAATMIGFVFMFIIMKRSQKYFVDRQESLGTLNGYIEEMYSGHDVVRISRANDRIKEMFRGMNRAVYEANRKSQFLSGIMQPLMNVIGNLGYVAVCVLGAALVMNGSIKFGVITAFILYVRLFTSPLTTIAQGMTQGTLPLIGYNYTSGNHKRMKVTIKTAFAYSFLVACVGAVLLWMLAAPISRCFIADAETVRYGQHFLKIICLACPTIAVNFMVITVFQAIGKKVQPLCLSLLRKGSLDVVFMLILNGAVSVSGIAWATPFADWIAFVISVVLIVPRLRQLKNE